LDLSEHDHRPSVPRRKNSNGDLSHTFLMACQQSLEASCPLKSTCSSTKTSSYPVQDTVQSLVISEFIRSLHFDAGVSNDVSIKMEKKQEFTNQTPRSRCESILSVLEEVEQTISMDLFQ
jgi:hypothetical protein